MKNYHEQDGCNNCECVFLMYEYDDVNVWYCNKNGDRPRCGSCAMCEDFLKPNAEWDTQKARLWNIWSNKHYVSPNGICDDYKKQIKEKIS